MWMYCTAHKSDFSFDSVFIMKNRQVCVGCAGGGGMSQMSALLISRHIACESYELCGEP